MCIGGGLRDNGLRNLRAIQKASNMMICGEDLGDCPAEVGPVLLELGILGLKIQRWCEGHTWKYAYLSVAYMYVYLYIYLYTYIYTYM